MLAPDGTGWWSNSNFVVIVALGLSNVYDVTCDFVWIHTCRLGR